MNYTEQVYASLENTRVVFVPPKPKLFVSATFTGLSWDRDWTKLKFTLTFGTSRLSVGGITF